MKVLMLRPSYEPEISGGNHLAIDLIEDLIKENHEVELVVPSPTRVNKDILNKYKSLKYEEKYRGKLKIHRISVSVGENNIFLRAIRMLLISLKMFWKTLTIKNVSIIMSHSMPPFIGPLSVLTSKFKKIPLVYWEQDILSESLISTGVATKGIKKSALFSLARLIERISSNGSNHIITISEKFKKRQLKIGKKESECDVVYNWIDVNNFKPVSRKENHLFNEFKLNPKNFYITYCGNLGLPQNVEILIDAAKKLEKYKDIKFLILGNGVRKQKIKEYILNSKVSNVELYPLVPLEEAAYAYSIGDVGIVLGRKGTSNNGFPSKTWSIMAAGQAIVSCFDMDSELSEFVNSGNCGIALPPDNPQLLAEAIEKLYHNRDLTSQYQLNSREFVTNNFSREPATSNIIKILQRNMIRNG
ncbi:putative glycosyl transferase [Jeotgalicoccus saudimassiliensis]|uniref:Putative glycosyl transferase n=1 Tax=Jeotgalicoccus saudimassiliensis TaxID=1461582 RepID=A0A078LZB6_9STAP|nr:glycosyltransferase family 4 protein [Jeotgalicoccus saudimassiliensis]CEA00478.1 putative glycosyl transferase [Jeotgalicoccus saudimassiliensis]